MFTSIVKFEGILLFLAGCTHLVYMLGGFTPTPMSEPIFWGGTFFGVAYFFFGLHMIRGKTNLLLITLIVNIFGLTSVFIAGDTSPLAEIDPYLIAVDFISVPTLMYLNFQKSKAN